MLTTDQKEAILRRAGVPVPAFPQPSAIDAQGAPEAAPRALYTPQDVTSPRASQIAQWAQEIETLYVAYVAHRAAKSLRDDEAARGCSTLERKTESGC